MTFEELRERQSWSLNKKIDHSLGVIEQFYTQLDGRCYVSFSGGKDSTVLYWLARKLYPDIKAVFCNTRNEYPEIAKFVLDMKLSGNFNIEIVTPPLKPHEVCEIYGFPIASKQTSKLVDYYRNKPDTKLAKLAVNDDKRSYNRVYNKWQYLFDAPYNCSDKCCEMLKKRPMHEYDLRTNTYPIIGTMACESKTREGAYIKAGQCNTFNNRDKRKQKSRPLSIWLEKDVLECIERYDIPICEIYSDPMIDRTGCAYCGFGISFHPERFDWLYKHHPKMYKYAMGLKNNGVEFRVALREALKLDGLYLPDEKPKNLFDI